MFRRNDFPLSVPRAYALALIATVLNLSCISVSAQEQPVAPQVENRAGDKMTELKKAFWFCDHAATKGTIDMNHAAACSAITDELKEKMFGGDFDKLVDWWRENKVAQHQELDASTGEMPASHTEEAKRRFPGRI